jgi:ABC-type multidrug transport system ATPase subunit
VLVDSYPALTMPTKPTTVYESVYIRGQQFAGNQCPANSSTPTDACPPGFYCPSPGEAITCPSGYYCKRGSQTPSKCPALTSCPEGSAKATLSWTGFIMLAGVLGVLWISYLLMTTTLRMNQRKLGRTQAARERLWKLLNPLFASQQHSKSQAFRAFKAIRPKITIEFDNLGLTLRDGHSILSGVSGRFTHSRVAAIMGPSGAGKSTFLNVIMGKTAGLGQVTGGIRANGREMRPEDLRGIVGFVPQEDIVHEDLTVRENLVYSARLRLSAAKPLREQFAIVDDVINVLQLRHVQHSVVGSAERRGISGGQRKRVNIGMELVAKPSILFMDEPTSGLDATAAADILGALKRMAGLGMNIITVIHQPRFSIFSLFDDVMLLCKGGKLAYLGPSRLALPYMESVGFALPPNENPADFAMDVLSGSVPRANYPAFQPEDLVPLWEAHGLSWIKTQESIPAVVFNRSSGTDASSGPAAEAVDPEQLRLLEEGFDAADDDGDEAIDGAGLKVLLRGIGLEPTAADVNMILAELAERSSGLITKSAFMQYVRYGGRPPTADAPTPTHGVGGSQRRVDSLYRVYSIEQYTLGNALSELAAANLPAALKSDPPTSLKSMAAAAMEMQQAQGSLSPSSSGLTLQNSSKKELSLAQNTIFEESESGSETETVRTTSLTSVASLDLPESVGAGGVAPGGKGGSSGDSELVSNSSNYTRNGSIIKLPDDLPLETNFKSRVMHALSLDAGSGQLRSTPGVFGQLYILIIRAGVKWARNWTTRFSDLMLLILAAVACGAMHGTGSVATDVRGQCTLTLLTLGILSASTSLSVFGKDKLVFWRENASGVAVLPYFLANTILNLIDVALHPLVFLAIYTSMTLPSISLGMYYLIGFLVVWWTSSAGCLISVLVNNSANALVAAVAVVMIAGGFINGVSPNYRELGVNTKRLTSLSYNRWAVEAVVINSYENYPPYMWPLSKALINLAGYCGLDASGVPSIAKSAKGNYVIASDAPAWDDPWQRPGEGFL